MARYEDEVGFYELNPFPGCNQIVVSNHAFVKKELRGKGHGTAQHRRRLNKIVKLGYDYAICTVKQDNSVQRAILERAGWHKLDVFFNKETENHVCIYGRQM